MANHQQRKAIVGQIDAEQVRLDLGLVGLAHADDVTITRGGAGLAIAASSASITQGGAVAFVSGGPMTVTQGGGQTLIAGGAMTVTQGGGGILVATQASVEQSVVGVLLCGQASLGEGTRVLLSTRQAIAMGVALGLVFALAGRLLRRGAAHA
jgi:hypothetical protein